MEACIQEAVQLVARIDALKDRLQEDEKTLQTTRERLTETRVVSVFLQEALERTRRDEESRLAEIATVALREACPDEDLTVRLQPVRWRNRPGTRIRLVCAGRERPLMGYCGGGVIGILGIIFRILTVIRHPSLQRVLLLDEPLCHVSPEYHEATSLMLRNICRDFEFKVLVITQISGLVREADQHLVAVRDKGRGVVLEPA